ncbi:Vinorine synthase [Handroanthus impetiginosus]|uniref:Vinorine synthase n=1 Tax=Handroanthus impetiginosus TaxID=429701 RepID=A0A2G9HBK8_9LAMI|nr:Vinorine synthase [Handroanthus impetiginosus]
MDVLNVEIISKEMIKPFLPTPDHLKKLKHSLLDQHAPQYNVPLIFFYHNENLSSFNISQLLKQSLSRILTLFPPMAGRIQENSYIDCNDDGVYFVEARVHAGLDQVIKEPRMQELQQFLAVDPLGQTDDNAILSVKINFFDCGGIAIGVCFSHKMTDCASFVAFINAWAARCREEAEVIQPTFDLPIRFPPTALATSGDSMSVGINKGKIMTKRLVFDKEKLAKLKQIGTSNEVKNPTKVEAVSAFIWRCMIEEARAKPDMKKTSFAAVHAVNLRPRAIPPIPGHAFGNCWGVAFAFLSQTEDSCDLVSKLRSGIREINADCIKKLQNGDYLSDFSKWIDFSKNDTAVCNFSSWCRFPMYEVDFGWGKPIWVCTATVPFKNVVFLMSNQSGDGIEAWLNMSDYDMEMLETHYEQLN